MVRKNIASSDSFDRKVKASFEGELYERTSIICSELEASMKADFTKTAVAFQGTKPSVEFQINLHQSEDQEDYDDFEARISPVLSAFIADTAAAAQKRTELYKKELENDSIFQKLEQLT